jgi:hypothetical protein
MAERHRFVWKERDELEQRRQVLDEGDRQRRARTRA